MEKKYTSIFLGIIFFFALYFPKTIHAACRAEKPGSAPTIISAVGANESVTLTWTEAKDPVTYYLIAYGTSPTKLEYGNTNIGPRGTTSFTIRNLINGTRYYFRVRAGNGCRPGKFSHTISTKAGVSSLASGPNLSLIKQTVLGASTHRSASEEAKKVGSVKNIKKPVPICLTCNGLQLLLIEAVALIVFLSLSLYINKLFLKSGFSFLIPIAVSGFYLFYQHNCSSESFTCRYFFVLNVVIFVLITMVYKHIFINWHDKKSDNSIS